MIDVDVEETHAVGYWFIGLFIAATLILALAEKCSAAGASAVCIPSRVPGVRGCN